MSVLSALIVAVEIAARKRDEARRVLQEALAVQQAAQARMEQKQTDERAAMQYSRRVQDR